MNVSPYCIVRHVYMDVCYGSHVDGSSGSRVAVTRPGRCCLGNVLLYQPPAGVKDRYNRIYLVLIKLYNELRLVQVRFKTCQRLFSSNLCYANHQNDTLNIE